VEGGTEAGGFTSCAGVVVMTVRNYIKKKLGRKEKELVAIAAAVPL
jgi:hypothetical protein